MDPLGPVILGGGEVGVAHERGDERDFVDRVVERGRVEQRRAECAVGPGVDRAHVGALREVAGQDRDLAGAQADQAPAEQVGEEP